MKKYILVLLAIAIGYLAFSKLVRRLFSDEHERDPNSVHRSFLLSAPNTFDPLQAMDTNTQFLLSHLNDPLVFWSLEKGIQPGLAEKWIQSESGLEVDFTIRSGVRFSNGVALGAKDIVLALNRLVSENSYYRDHFSNIKAVEAPSDNRVLIRLRRRDPKLLFLLAGTAGLISKRGPDGTFITSGPFRLLELREDYLEIGRNPYYWGKFPPTDTIKFQIGSAERAAKLAREGVIDDAILVPFPTRERITDVDQWTAQLMWAVWGIGFDTRLPAAAKIHIRTAIADALRSEDFISSIFPGNQIAFGLIPRGIPGSLDGAPELALASGLPTKDTIKIYVPTEVPKIDAIAKWIIDRTKKSGVDVKVVGAPVNEILSKLGRGKMDAFLLSFNPEYPSPLFYLNSVFSSGRSNFFGLSQQEFLDVPLGLTDSGLPPEEFNQRMKHLDTMLISRAFFIPLMQIRQQVWARDCVNEIKLSPLSEGYFSLREVRNRCR